MARIHYLIDNIIFQSTNSKPALTEGLEIDQYIWAILNTLASSPTDVDVTIDSEANWKAIGMCPTSGIKVSSMLTLQNSQCEDNIMIFIAQIQIEDDSETKRLTNHVMSPGSTQLPTWDNSQAMSPYMSPDMSSIASGSMIGQK